MMAGAKYDDSILKGTLNLQIERKTSWVNNIIIIFRIILSSDFEPAQLQKEIY